MKHLTSTAIALALTGAALAQERPNIVFIFSDDHALNAISAYGGRFKDIAPTPHIDRLAKEGAIFHNSFCANSICGPSRACILTGKHSHLNGFMRNGDKFDGSQMTFPKLMQKADYQTALVGKWHLHTAPTGFDFWEVLPGQGHYYNPDFRQMNGKMKRYDGYVTDIITDNSINWLEGRDKTKPFILMTQHKAPHRNWAPAKRHLTLFDDVTMPEPETLRDDYSGRSEWLKKNEMSLDKHFHWKHDLKFHGRTPFPDKFVDRVGNGEYTRMSERQQRDWDEAYGPKNYSFLGKVADGKLSDDEILQFKYQRYVKDYLRTIKAVDENVGRLLDYLDKEGLSENTIVIYSSDQGFYLGEHGWYDKRWMFEQSMKMPFLVRWPKVIKAGTVEQSMIQNIDYGPTFLDLAGAEVPSEMQGQSLVPVFKGEQKAEDARESVYYAYYENPGIHNVPRHDGVRTKRYKIFFIPQANEWQLFDLERDPKEMKSVHDDPEYAEVFANMQKIYTERKKHYGSQHK
ncbi:sulfatase [Rubritalea tangerina]|uniref:Sulfatase/phosphatase domain-containing protein n=1 Tax=Rubritalea tangerina TaxID=430798 RepID=A0ABW4Z6F1_9BACT